MPDSCADESSGGWGSTKSSCSTLKKIVLIVGNVGYLNIYFRMQSPGVCVVMSHGRAGTAASVQVWSPPHLSQTSLPPHQALLRLYQQEAHLTWTYPPSI